MLTIMSSMAQEESRSISENVTWGQRKRFADGKVSLPYKAFLGYEKGLDGLPKIVDEEANIVRRIYRHYLQGKTSCWIARQLTEEGIPTPAGRVKWRPTTIESILTNEKYKGSALLQKSFTTDFLQKKMKKNEGEVPQYYVENSHEAIINPLEWAAVQNEISRRKALDRHYSGASIFASRLVCAECGSFYGAKVWHSTDSYRQVVLQCNNKFKGEKRCSTPTLKEDDVKKRFLAVFNTMILNKDTISEDCRIVQKQLTDCTLIDSRLSELTAEMAVVTELTRRCVSENAAAVQDQAAYYDRYNSLLRRYENTKSKVESLKMEKQHRMERLEALAGFMFTIHETDEPITVFDETLWFTVVDTVKVQSNGSLTFRFYNNAEIDG